MVPKRIRAFPSTARAGVRANRSRSTMLALGVVVAATVGYVLGVEEKVVSRHSHTSATPPRLRRTAIAGSALLESPPGWAAAPTPVSVPGLRVADVVVLVPAGDPMGVALLTGQLPRSEASPLPRTFVARLHGEPVTHVVTLTQTEAFRYTHVVLPGFDRELTIYAIPRSGGDTTVLVCSVAPAAAQEMRACEQIVSTLRQVGQVNGEVLAPDPAYGQPRERDDRRARPRARLPQRGDADADAASGRPTSRDAARPSVRARGSRARSAPTLACGGAGAGGALARDPGCAGRVPQPCGRGPLPRRGGYVEARNRVYAAEAGVGAALESYALLGYARS